MIPIVNQSKSSSNTGLCSQECTRIEAILLSQSVLSTFTGIFPQQGLNNFDKTSIQSDLNDSPVISPLEGYVYASIHLNQSDRFMQMRPHQFSGTVFTNHNQSKQIAQSNLNSKPSNLTPKLIFVNSTFSIGIANFYSFQKFQSKSRPQMIILTTGRPRTIIRVSVSNMLRRRK